VSLEEIEEAVAGVRQLTADARVDLLVVNVDFMETRAVEGVRAITYRFVRDESPEFQPLPPLPSTGANRLLWVRGEQLAPVALFGRAFRMAERTHPDADGHAVIAEGIAARLPELASFARFVGTASD
jgi:lysophospholipase L1-like esterase